MRADYVMVGGFLGAGKTTALLRLAEHLDARGRRVGLITNDQSSGLVDTRIVGAYGYPVQEITGGCFCCRFNSLTMAAERLTETAKPDVFLAEPVGSCTDLRATVQYPLRRLYGDHYRIAPLSVLVDPLRALRVLGIERGRAFSPKVCYVYDKQLEEADLIVINKSDLLDAARQARLEAALRATYPAADVYAVSARTGDGLDRWFARIAAAEPDSRTAPTVDYDVYAEGEALLGWCNATFRLVAVSPFDGNLLLVELTRALHNTLAPDAPGPLRPSAGSGRSRTPPRRRARWGPRPERVEGRGTPPTDQTEIAHCKMTLTPDEDVGDLAVLNLVGSDREPELSHLLQDEVTSGELIVNLRAECDPELLRRAVVETLAEVTSRHGVRSEPVHIEHFRPARPSPTHRMATLQS